MRQPSLRLPISAAWTRRSNSGGGSAGSQSKSKNKKSWKQRHEKFVNPFLLDVYVSPRYVTAKVVHRVTSRVVAVATTTARDLRLSLASLADEAACRLIGRLIAQRAMDVDVFAVTFRLRKGEKYEGKVAMVVDSMVDEGGMMLI